MSRAFSQISLLAARAHLGDDGVGVVSRGDALGKPRGLFHAADFAQELVDAGHAHAGHDALEADAAVVFLLEKAKQVDLVFVAGGVVGMAALRGIGNVGTAVPDEEAFAKPGSGGDEGTIADLAGIAFSKGEDLVAGELGYAIAVGFKVVDEEDVGDAEIG